MTANKELRKKVMGHAGGRFAQAEHAVNIMGTLKRIVDYFTKEKALLISMFAVVTFGALCGIYAPSLQSDAIDIIAKKAEGNLSVKLFSMLGVYVLFCLFKLVQGRLSARLSQRIVGRMREELHSKIIDLPIKYLDTHSHGDVMSRMTNDIDNISSTVSQALPSLFSGVLTVIGTAGVMILYCPPLALLSCGTVVLTFITTKILSAKVRKYSRKRQALLGKLNGTVEEMIAGYKTVVSYNHQEITVNEFCDVSDSLTKSGIRTDIYSGVLGPIMSCISNIGFVIIAAVGGFFAVKGLISVGVISAFIVYAKQFSRPINEMAQIYGQIQTAIAGAERVFDVLDEESEDMAGEALTIGSCADISFNNVNFSYEEGHPVISDFTLTVPAGKKVALVGATGSGKTTVVNLLMRFYEPDSGSISINGQEISRASRASLRKNTAIVLQDTVLFSDTVRNNITYGNAEATDEILQSAVETSCTADMIRLLPKGLDTVLSASGSEISQGQQQLLAIARAFVSNPMILVLDEATSSVDTRTEKSIQSAMQEIMKNRTSIVVAHRLSTVRDADIIVVMDHGRIVENGNHETLLKNKGKYYELYMTQYAGFEI